MAANSSAVLNALKLWIFPSVAGLCIWFAGSMLNDIRRDMESVKSDVKLLLAQSNIDKTRIDNLERRLGQVENKLLFSNEVPQKDPKKQANQPVEAVLRYDREPSDKDLPKRTL